MTGGTLLTVLAACSLPRFLDARDLQPRVFLGTTVDSGLVGIATTDALASCTQGKGEAQFFAVAGYEGPSQDPLLTVDCRRLIPLTPEEISRLLEGKGWFRGVENIPENATPLDTWSRGYLRIPGGNIYTEYFLRYNQAEIRLVEWSRGNHWGGEVDHTYRVDLADGQRRIRTIRSRERTVELD